MGWLGLLGGTKDKDLRESVVKTAARPERGGPSACPEGGNASPRAKPGLQCLYRTFSPRIPEWKIPGPVGEVLSGTMLAYAQQRPPAQDSHGLST